MKLGSCQLLGYNKAGVLSLSDHVQWMYVGNYIHTCLLGTYYVDCNCTEPIYMQHVVLKLVGIHVTPEVPIPYSNHHLSHHIITLSVNISL